MTPTLPLLTDFILEVFRLNGELLAAGDALVAPVGLTSARWQVLGAVALAATPLPVAHIARNMGLSRQAVQRLANEMEAGGLVRFAPNPHHRRAKLVLLTVAGEAAFAAAMARYEPWAQTLGAEIEASALAEALVLLRRLRQRLERPAGEEMSS